MYKLGQYQLIIDRIRERRKFIQLKSKVILIPSIKGLPYSGNDINLIIQSL